MSDESEYRRLLEEFSNPKVNLIHHPFDLTSEDYRVLNLVCGLFAFGWQRKEKIRDLVGSKKFNYYWSNLKRNKFFAARGRIAFNPEEGLIGVALMMAVIQGHFKRTKAK